MALTLNGSGTIGGLSAYQSGAGLTLITSASFTAQSSVSVNNCFSSTYENYLLTLRISSFTGSPSLAMYMRMRASGTDDTGSNYASAGGYVDNGSVGALFGGLSQTAGQWIRADVSTPVDAVMTIKSPQATVPTGVLFNSVAVSNATKLLAPHGWFINSASTQFDGFTVYPASGNITGTLRVYGYTNG